MFISRLSCKKGLIISQTDKNLIVIKNVFGAGKTNYNHLRLIDKNGTASIIEEYEVVKLVEILTKPEAPAFCRLSDYEGGPSRSLNIIGTDGDDTLLLIIII